MRPWMQRRWSAGRVTKTSGESVSRCKRDRCAADERYSYTAGRHLYQPAQGLTPARFPKVAKYDSLIPERRFAAFGGSNERWGRNHLHGAYADAASGHCCEV